MNRVVCLTGGSSGIGLALAKALMRAGDCVYAVSRHPLASETDPSGGCIEGLGADVTDEQSLRQVVETIVSRQGRIDVLVCNAGNGIAGAVEDTSDSETRYQFETNFFGVANTIRACLPVMRRQGAGRIVVTSSVAAIAPIPYQSLYSASKAALLLYIEALSLEVKPFGIQCSVCLPGDTKTGFTSARKYTAASQSEASAYRQVMARAVGVMEHDERNGMAPEAVAAAVLRNLDRRHMRMRVVPGLSYQLLCLAMKLLPTWLKLWVIGKIYG